MKEHPIIFSGDMVIKIMTCAKCGHISVPFPCENCGAREFVKTMTRRVITLPDSIDPEQFGSACWELAKTPKAWKDDPALVAFIDLAHPTDSYPYCVKCPYGAPGDLLVPRTTWAACKRYDTLKPKELPDDKIVGSIWNYWLGIEKPDYYGKSRPGRFLPKKLWWSVPRLVNKSIRAERAQEITREDVYAEGLQNTGEGWGPNGRLGSTDGYEDLWDSINKKRGYGWAKNPWVWVVEFERAE